MCCAIAEKRNRSEKERSSGKQFPGGKESEFDSTIGTTPRAAEKLDCSSGWELLAHPDNFEFSMTQGDTRFRMNHACSA